MRHGQGQGWQGQGRRGPRGQGGFAGPGCCGGWEGPRGGRGDWQGRGRWHEGRGPGGRGPGGCCGGYGHGPWFEEEPKPTQERDLLEERRRDLEEELAQITTELRRLENQSS